MRKIDPPWREMSSQGPDDENAVWKERVSHPSHYNHGKIEVIDFIEDQELGFPLGNAVKYICRCRWKDNMLEDLKKARWYIDWVIKELEDDEQTDD